MERGDILLGWLTKVVVVLGLLGVVAFDAIAVGAAKASLPDDGTYAALEASKAWGETKDIQRAFDAARAAVTAKGGTIEATSFRIDADGTVHLALSRTADTVVVERVGPIRDWATVEATASARAWDS